MHTIIVLERYQSSSLFWANMLKFKKILDMTVEEVLDKYEGFEGDLIASFQLKEHANETEMEEAIRKSEEIKNSFNYRIFHILSGSTQMPNYLKNQILKVGYDVGVCEEEKTIYSSIFNEILFGNLEELIQYKNFLNKNFLFENKTFAENYVHLHNELSAQGKGVEDYEALNIYEIWKQKNLIGLFESKSK